MQTIPAISVRLQNITTLNLDAIKNKTEKSEQAADDAMKLLITIVSFIFIVGLTFVINFPSVITNPIQKLTDSIREIGLKNFSHRIHIDSNDEFGEVANAFNEMAEKVEHFENSNLNQIIFEKSRAEAVINSLKDASIGIDKNDIVLFANDQAMQLLGITAEDIIGINIAVISKRNDLFRFLLEEKNNLPFKIVVGDRENYFVKELIEIDQANAKSRVIVLKNITSFKELDVAKNNFIATISHELKTPLASSDLGLKLLTDERTGTLSPEQQELIKNLRLDNQRMLRILSELLNMSQVEAGKILMDLGEVDVYELADNAIEGGYTAANAKQIIIKKDFGANIGKVKADPEKTGWVLNNLLSNAIKHAPSDSIISLKIRELVTTIEFSVIDKGPGIPEEYIPRVFDRFFKVPGSASGGTGLGLAISKEFIEAEGGMIWIKSEIGSGTEFGFRLPKI
ncbi:MAG: ATP-binding protein [Chitinophagaceae bacterium]